MTDTTPPPSLLPYLQSGSGRFRLLPGLESTKPPSLTHPPQNPFQFKDVADPFSVLGHAGIASDMAGPLLPLHMLMQRSDYTRDAQDRSPRTNLSIDHRWQQIFSVVSTPPLKALAFLLAEQIGENGQLLPLNSLFYCAAQQSFFHPPCPRCGQALLLCTDDTLLSRHGLEGYSTSLRRYLFCRQCAAKAETTSYYVPNRRGNDPDCVFDGRQLVKNWALLEAPGALPCPSCPSRTACYGPNLLAAHYLSSFSFYPFYMLLLRADSGMRPDFQALLSGSAQAAECLVTKDDEGPERKPEDATPKPSTSADAAIHALLVDIAARWKDEPKEKKPASPSGKVSGAQALPPFPPQEPVDLMETVILTSTSLAEDEKYPAGKPGGGSGIPERGDTGSSAVIAPTPQFDPDATILLHQTLPEGRGRQESVITQPFPPPPEASLQETLVISPLAGRETGGNLRPPAAALKAPENRPVSPSNQRAVDEDLDETLIQRPEKKS